MCRQGQEICDLCSQPFTDSNNLYICLDCDQVAHSGCHGLQNEEIEGLAVHCLRCRQSTLQSTLSGSGEDPDYEEPLEADESEPLDYNEGDSEYHSGASSSDDDDSVDGRLEGTSIAAQLAKDAILEAKDEAAFFKSEALADFISRKQPNDETRHMTALLSLPPWKRMGR